MKKRNSFKNLLGGSPQSYGTVENGEFEVVGGKTIFQAEANIKMHRLTRPEDRRGSPIQRQLIISEEGISETSAFGTELFFFFGWKAVREYGAHREYFIIKVHNKDKEEEFYFWKCKHPETVKSIVKQQIADKLKKAVDERCKAATSLTLKTAPVPSSPSPSTPSIPSGRQSPLTNPSGQGNRTSGSSDTNSGSTPVAEFKSPPSSPVLHRRTAKDLISFDDLATPGSPAFNSFDNISFTAIPSPFSSFDRSSSPFQSFEKLPAGRNSPSPSPVNFQSHSPSHSPSHSNSPSPVPFSSSPPTLSPVPFHANSNSSSPVPFQAHSPSNSPFPANFASSPFNSFDALSFSKNPFLSEGSQPNSRSSSPFTSMDNLFETPTFQPDWTAFSQPQGAP